MVGYPSFAKQSALLLFSSTIHYLGLKVSRVYTPFEKLFISWPKNLIYFLAINIYILNFSLSTLIINEVTKHLARIGFLQFLVHKIDYKQEESLLPPKIYLDFPKNFIRKNDGSLCSLPHPPQKWLNFGSSAISHLFHPNKPSKSHFSFSVCLWLLAFNKKLKCFHFLSTSLFR